MLLLCVDGVSLGVPRPFDLKAPQRGINLIEFGVGQLDKGAILLHRSHLGRARNWYDSRKASATRVVGCPRDGKLCDGASLFNGETLNLLDQL